MQIVTKGVQRGKRHLKNCQKRMKFLKYIGHHRTRAHLRAALVTQDWETAMLPTSGAKPVTERDVS